ncbi:MAG: hypothetical protein ABIJ56_00520 [Pseudomonadota bacterium]
MDYWPFADPKNVAVFTVGSVWEKGRPILYVYHDEDDGARQFHADREPDIEEASILALDEIVKLDPSIAELTDLPLGWCACRESQESPWVRQKMK